MDAKGPLPPLPPRLVTDDDLKAFYEAMKLYDVPKAEVASDSGLKRKGHHLGGLDTQQYGRGKRAREVCCLCLILITRHLLSESSCLCFPFCLILIIHFVRYALMKSNGQKRNLRRCVRLSLLVLLR